MKRLCFYIGRWFLYTGLLIMPFEADAEIKFNDAFLNKKTT